LGVHKNVLPADGATSANTCRRKGDNEYTYFIAYIYIYASVKDIIYGKMHGMESLKIIG
jgi:hypothetical protein